MSRFLPVNPTEEPVGKRGRVGHCDIQATFGLNHAADLRERGREAVNVLEAVVGDHRTKATVRKRKMRGVGLDEILASSRRRPFQIYPDYRRIGAGTVGKTAR